MFVYMTDYYLVGYKYPNTLSDLVTESYANYKDHSGPGYSILHFTLILV